MRKLIAVFSVLMITDFLSASNYPPDYLNQTAKAISIGPAFIAEVNTMTSGLKYVIGYKKSRILSGYDHVNVYIKVHYKLISFSGDWVNSMIAEKNLKLLPEWNKTGYISGEVSQYTSYGNDELLFVPSSALSYNRVEIEKIELAFYANGKWDSNYGNNYVIHFNSLYNGVKFKSAYTSSNIALDT